MCAAACVASLGDMHAVDRNDNSREIQMNARNLSALLLGCTFVLSSAAYAQAAGGTDQTSPIKPPDVQKQSRDKPQTQTNAQKSATTQEYQNRSNATGGAPTSTGKKKTTTTAKKSTAPVDKKTKQEQAAKQQKELQKASSGG